MRMRTSSPGLLSMMVPLPRRCPVAVPTAHRADAGIRAAVGVLHVGIELQERIPDGELVMVVDLLEQRRGRAPTGRAAFDAEVRRPRGDDDEEDGDDGDEAEKDFLDHGFHCVFC